MREGSESEDSVPVPTELMVGTMLCTTDRNRMRCLGEEEGERGRGGGGGLMLPLSVWARCVKQGRHPSHFVVYESEHPVRLECDPSGILSKRDTLKLDT